MALEIAKVSRPRERRNDEARGKAFAGRPLPVASPRSTLAMSISEVALMWILHQHALSVGRRRGVLYQQISDFSITVFKTILRDSPGTKHEHLWMIYFKGLIVSNTHPRDVMVEAIHRVQAQNFAMWRASFRNHAPLAGDVHEPPQAATMPQSAEHADSDVLRQINTALGNAPIDAST